MVGAATASMLLHAAVTAWLLIPTAEPAAVPDTIAVDLVLEEPATASEPATGHASEEPTPPAATPAPPAPELPPPEEPATEAPALVAMPAPVPAPMPTSMPTPSRKPRVPAAVVPPKPAATGAPSPATPGTAPAAVPPVSSAAPPDHAPPDHAATDYAATINGRLERSKIYPRLARVRREEGAAQVRFTVAPDGTVTACAVTASSGHELLDEEACALVYRASPLPPPPGAAPNTRLDMSAPIRFSMS